MKYEPSEVKENDFHMGKGRDLVKNLAIKQRHRTVLNSHLGGNGCYGGYLVLDRRRANPGGARK